MASQRLIITLILGLSTQAFCRRGPAHRELQSQSSSGTIPVTILHTNDIHARYQPATSSFGACDLNKFAACYGGFARLQTAADAIRNSTDHDVLFLDAGDITTGTLWDTLYHGQLAPLFQNHLGVQAMTLGNHDFDYGPDSLANYTLQTEFPILGANINASAHPILKDTIQPYTIITLSNGVRIGVVGFTTETTAVTSSAGPQVQFVPPQDAVPVVLQELKSLGIEHIIGLSHAGYDQDLLLAANPDFAEIDLIIGGHTHTFLYPEDSSPPALLKSSNATDTPTGAYPTMVDNGGKFIPVVQGYWAGRYLGRLETQWTAGGDLVSISGTPILMGGANSTSFIPCDPVVVDMIDDYEGPVLEANGQIVGSSEVDLEGDPYIIRRYETNLGNLVAAAATETALRYIGDELEQLGALPMVTLINAGAIRQTLPKGSITLAQVVNTMPYGNWVVIKKLTGATLMETLENAVSALDHPQGRFVQVQGLRYAYDGNATVGERIVKAVLPNNQSVADVKEVIAVITNYMAAGNDGFSMLVDPPLLLDTSTPLEDATEHYLLEHSPVNPPVDGRIVVCGNQYGPATPDDPMCQ